MDSSFTTDVRGKQITERESEAGTIAVEEELYVIAILVLVVVHGVKLTMPLRIEHLHHILHPQPTQADISPSIHPSILSINLVYLSVSILSH